MTDQMRHFDPADAPAGIQHLLNGIVAPRPIAWVSTWGPDGTANVAPHSYTTVFNVSPPVIGFVSSGRKDTLNNVEATGAFGCAFTNGALADAMNLTSADFPPHVSEFDWAGLTVLPGEVANAPLVADAPASFECRVIDIHPVPGTASVLVLGEVVRVHTAERIWDGDRIDMTAYDPIGRTTGSGYTRIGEQFHMKRPTWQELQEAGAQPARRADRPAGERS
jgi:flavin reductase (DIM6/NTAB) family NADH-FMN oxidoreductase RutF